MLLYLLRHADAATEAETDDARRLSDKGVGQTKRAAQFCARQQILPELILTSPLPRASETAEKVASGLEAKVTVEIAEFLKPGMLPESALSALKRYSVRQSVMLVGHEPDFSLLVAHLLGVNSHTSLHLRKGSLTGLEVRLFKAGAARLQFSIPCKMM